jgi:hypothetical protein
MGGENGQYDALPAKQHGAAHSKSMLVNSVSDKRWKTVCVSVLTVSAFV